MMSSRGGLKSAEQLQADWQAKQSDSKYKAMQKQRNKLPAAEVAQHLVDLVANNQVLLLHLPLLLLMLSLLLLHLPLLLLMLSLLLLHLPLLLSLLLLLYLPSLAVYVSLTLLDRWW